MKCSVCGTENEDYLLFCVMCGARLPRRPKSGGAGGCGTRSGKDDAGAGERPGDETSPHGTTPSPDTSTPRP